MPSFREVKLHRQVPRDPHAVAKVGGNRPCRDLLDVNSTVQNKLRCAIGFARLALPNASQVTDKWQPLMEELLGRRRRNFRLPMKAGKEIVTSDK